MHGKCSNILEIVHDGVTVVTEYCYYRILIGSNMAYRIVVMLITLRDIQGHLPTASNLYFFN